MDPKHKPITSSGAQAKKTQKAKCGGWYKLILATQEAEVKPWNSGIQATAMHHMSQVF